MNLTAIVTTQSDTNNMYSNCRCIITLKTSHDTSLPTTTSYKCWEKQQSATQTLLIFSAHDTRGTHSLALHSKQWACRNFPFPLKGSSPSSCSSPEARGASQSPPSDHFTSFTRSQSALLFLPSSVILPFTVTSCLSSHCKYSLPELSRSVSRSLTLYLSLSGVSAAVRNVTLFLSHTHLRCR